jgi:predicted  nucleic acid-binding Zn-ribbon protein
MLEQLRQISFLIASLRQNLIAITQENEELRKRYTALQNEYDLMKNEYDECKRNLEKTTQETSNSES